MIKDKAPSQRDSKLWLSNILLEIALIKQQIESVVEQGDESLLFMTEDLNFRLRQQQERIRRIELDKSDVSQNERLQIEASLIILKSRLCQALNLQTNRKTA